MKNFLEKHILFPKRYGLQPYLWLLFLLPVFAGLAHYALYQQAIATGLILIFLKAYRDGYELPHHARNVAIQLIIASFITANPWFATFGLQTFTGFEIGFSPVSDKRFRHYLWAYYGSLIFSFGTAFIVQKLTTFSLGSITWILVGTSFCFLAPIIAKSMSRTYDLTKQNQALEKKVRALERERIAYDLHDNLGQAFSTITLQSELAMKLLDKNPEKAKAELEKIAENSREKLNLVREIVAGLRQESSGQVLEQEQKALELAGITLSVSGESGFLPDSLAPVLKEALTNVIHHSRASSVRVRFEAGRLIIADNGIGLGASSASHGIEGMQHRATEIGGQLSFASDNGTTLTLTFPDNKPENPIEKEI
ncbi:MAG: sensor histidine kinase [Streptococcaceae bacterium]|jgi:two-component system sensor histidine kinase DesK|nr:sensor histidine kinase [Streptococcaceae bacterium]